MSMQSYPTGFPHRPHAPLARHEAAPPVTTLQAEPPGSCPDGAAHIARTLMTSLRLRTRALELSGQPGRRAAAEPPGLSRRDARNIVLRDPVASGGELCASLVVDDSHPYFFADPLTHVPGSLLLAGMLQLAELAITRCGMGKMFISAIDGRFRRAAAKDKPITLALTGGARPAQFKVKCVQGGQLLCECTLAASALPAPAVDAAAQAPRSLAPASGNALLGALAEEGGAVHADMLPLAPEHFFSDEGGEHHSLLYFLEAARQCFMQVAHASLDIPAGTAADLVELRCTLAAPIPRACRLRLLPSGHWTSLTQTGRVRIALMDGDTALGQAVVIARMGERAHFGLPGLPGHPALTQ